MITQSVNGKSLRELLTESGIKAEIYGSGDPQITNLAWDSRDAGPGSLFMALKGIHTDGHRYLGAALEQGAAALLISDTPEPSAALENRLDDGSLVVIKVEDTRRAMSPISAAFYGQPGRDMRIAGVTGTDGKSSTVSYLHQLLTLAGEKAGYLSTVAYNCGGDRKKNSLRQSTPEAPVIHRLLAEMKENGCRYAVVEATSHGLSPRNSRLADVPFTGAILTNVTQEHLEFHGTLEQYRKDKSELFRMSAANSGFAVINANDPHHSLFAEAAAGADIFYYSLTDNQKKAPQDLKEGALFTMTELTESPRGTSWKLKNRVTGENATVSAPLPGRFNVENVTAALIAAAQLTGRPLTDFAPLAARIKGVSGRMELVDAGQPFTVLVDYAHTPGAFEKILPDLRRQCRGRLILVFGSAGERDRLKRPVQGEIAARYGDIVIITDEDPRLEDARTILEEIAAGCPGLKREEELFLIEDRKEAMRKALSLATDGDTVATLGKGHESSIIYADGPRPWDEAGILKSLLKEAGWDS